MTVQSKAQMMVFDVVAGDGTYVLRQNGVPLLTPAGKPYRLPTNALAEAIAAEWRAQTDKVIPSTMPLTQLAATAIDIVPQQREVIVGQLMAHASTELLCHRAASPPALVRQQQEIWQPYLDWCARHFDALLHVGAGIMPIAQSGDAFHALRKAIETYDDFCLAGLSSAVDAAGSLVLGLALTEQHSKADAVFEAAELDAHFQIRKWGGDPVVNARHEKIRRELEACERWFNLLKK